MSYIQKIIDHLKKTSPGQPEFYQAVTEVLATLRPILKSEPKYLKNKILERLVEPDRQITFRVAWINDAGEIQVNKGWRLHFNTAIGPSKGGLRFHPSVNTSIVKFLGFEQIFKNALTGLAIGGGKGGSDFDPKGKSENEIMRFCQAFMTEMFRHVGPTIDVPAGDIGVGNREIGYMFGQWKRITCRHDGVFTGKGLNYGGSLGRTEATGYGIVYFAQNLLEARGESLEGKTCVVSGSGNVALYTVKKLLAIGATPVTVSDSGGTIYHEKGIDADALKQVKEVERGRLTRYLELCPDAQYIPVADYPKTGNYVWSVPCDAAFPCATQNELNEEDAKLLVKNGCKCVTEGSNMPSTLEAVDVFLNSRIAFGPAKAANSGGVGTSQLEMAQNASMQQWSFEEVDTKLHSIMKHAFDVSNEAANEFGHPGNLVMGANIASFRKVADAMISLGVY